MRFIRVFQIRSNKELLVSNQCHFYEEEEDREIILNINKIDYIELLQEATEANPALYIITRKSGYKGWLLEDRDCQIQLMIKELSFSKQNN